jgi:inward rectifier potassium channel
MAPRDDSDDALEPAAVRAPVPPAYPVPSRVVVRSGPQAPQIERRGVRRHAWDLYHYVLQLSWPRFLLGIAFGYLGINLVFALLYLAGGDAIANARPGSLWDAYMFSVQTLATIGYGAMAPKTPYADVLVALEAFLGLFGVAVGTSLMFTRFARPSSRILFSEKALVTVRDGLPVFMLRMANERGNQVVEAQVRLIISRNEVTLEGERVRRFHDLTLTRTFSPIFALSWTVVHPIDAQSPLYRATAETLAGDAAEIIVLVTGLDDTFQAPIHGRFSYLAADLAWDVRYRDILTIAPDGHRIIDYALFHDVVPLPAGAPRVLPWPDDAAPRS